MNIFYHWSGSSPARTTKGRDVIKGRSVTIDASQPVVYLGPQNVFGGGVMVAERHGVPRSEIYPVVISGTFLLYCTNRRPLVRVQSNFSAPSLPLRPRHLN